MVGLYNRGRTPRKVFRLADPAASGYEVRWPMYNNHFNTRYYASRQGALNDIETMWKAIITQELGIPRAQFKVRRYRAWLTVVVL